MPSTQLHSDLQEGGGGGAKVVPPRSMPTSIKSLSSYLRATWDIIHSHDNFYQAFLSLILFLGKGLRGRPGLLGNCTFGVQQDILPIM